ncbi:MAG TPA: ABC transporter permease [Acidimicrobiales bacterium]|nr:ABC transporter permease [Acidimicrobiales bacterium]
MTAVLATEAVAAPPRTGRPGWAVMWRVELTKLLSQVKVRAALVACVVVPIVFTLLESTQSSVPGDTLFGRWVHESGFAVSLFLLAFTSQWGLPFLVAIVSGDVCSEEDRLQTWPLLLTRSRSRGDVLAGKVLAAASVTVAGTMLLAISSTLSGVLVVGTQPVVGLSGAVLSSGTALAATLASWLVVLPPVLAVVAIAVLASVVSRNSWAGVATPVVVTLGFGLVSQFSAADLVRPLLPTAGFDAWHGLVRTGVYTAPIRESMFVSAAWIAVCVGVSAAVLHRRDVVQ